MSPLPQATLDTSPAFAAEVLTHLCTLLGQTPPRLSADATDGRVNSSKNEDEIKQHLIISTRSNEKFRNEWGLELFLSPSREWYDFSIKRFADDWFVPVNIKVSEEHSADNLNCKLGLYYALTGLMPDFTNAIAWPDFFEKLHAHLGAHDDKDYYFLCVNKRTPSSCFHASLKTLQELTPNGNNLPFQCNWSKNREPLARNQAEATSFLLTTFWRSLLSRGSPALKFKELFPEFALTVGG